MEFVFIKVSDVFNMSFDQVFIAGQLKGQIGFVTPGKWKLFVNGSATADLEAIGERRGSNTSLTDRVVAFKGQLDKTLFDLHKDEVLLIQQ
ncbi:hypothetical protein [Hymenobacter cellulosivorans]|uniref:Uncharacterized protein n=1 Tax=Hymenobacter cellulosivorans TaxID=2932249 RepID=A0ABY4FA31_9BACT|nr:hypothetical protein [Hymenobacter cellulosivorans]UOQ53529.1 hypothetical protein MUN80_01935 [Hymenobacter cellulosivorans]